MIDPLSNSTNEVIDRPTILIVEDNPVERQLIGKILRNADFEVIAVDCGEVVLDTVIQYQPDIILLDALLPDLDGFDVCAHLRENPKSLNIPIIMLTGLDDVISINRAYDAGATDFFTKPINHSLLVHRIRYLLRARLISEQLRISDQSLTNAQQIAGMGYWEFDSERRRLNLSDEVLRIYGLSMDSNESHDMSVFYDTCHPEDREQLERTIAECVHSNKDANLEYRILANNTDVKHLSMNISPMRVKGEVSNHILGIIIDITERKKSEQEIVQLAYSDTLTGLPNRSLLELYVDQAISRAHFSGLCVAVLAIDLDLFNRINNAMGHSAGDAVLQQLSARLNNLVNCREVSVYLDRLSQSTILDDIPFSMVARLGADSFVIVLPSVNRSSNDVADLALRLNKEFQSPFNYRGQELFVTSSMGVAYSESGSTTTGVILQQADLAMHEAKMQGRNTLREFSGDLVAQVSTHLSIQTDLRGALKNGDFLVYYQPKISSKDQSLCGFEALVRWSHPTKGMIPPDQFISVAEETGQIVELGRWVLETACRQTKQWIDQGLIDVRVAVNVAARQFKEGNIVEVVESVLGLTGLDEKNLELEITEGVLMSDATSSEHVAALRDQGIAIALDDFGTGYSSLSYITRFPIDTIKIDRSFVQDITEGSQQAVIVSAVTELAHGLGYKVVAEGVETQEELEVIRALNCDEVQGYYYCRPMPAGEMTEWLQGRSNVVTLGARAK